jgi:hypothetical protein
MARITILLSFDHELPLGGTPSYSEDLFAPTKEVLMAAQRMDVPITLFTDVLCADRFKEWDPIGFFEPYVSQIGEAINLGNDVQLHIHPHWVDSVYRGGSFVPSRSFTLSHFVKGASSQKIGEIVARAKLFLESICRSFNDNYKCIAYRAGGYNLSPATSDILSALFGNGIRIDSSIAKGYHFESTISKVDYRTVPDSPNWYIPLTGPVNQTASSGLYEIPIVSKPRTALNNLPFLVKRVIYRGRGHKLRGWGIHERGNTTIVSKLSRLFPQSAWLLSFDEYTTSVRDLMSIVEHHVRLHPKADWIIGSATSHPKSMGKYSRTLMERFVEKMRDTYTDHVQFSTYRQIYDDLNLRSKNVGPGA